MERAKPEPRPEQAAEQSSPAAKPEPQVTARTTTEPVEATPPAATPARGRGRGRSRGRGRRVVPRQVARRKPPPRAAAPSTEERGRARGRGRGRGRARGDSRGRGDRGRGRGAPVYTSNVVGLGQIAPARPRVASSAGSAATSRKSSAVSSMSLAPSSVGPASSGVELSISGSHPSAAQAQQREPTLVSFREHVEVDEFSDDDQADGSFVGRNLDISPYAGHVTPEGLLLPVSLPGLRDLPGCYAVDDAADRMEGVSVSGKEECVVAATGASEDVSPEMFPKESVGRKIAGSSLAFMQLPGLLAMMECADAPLMGNEGGRDPKLESSVAASVAAAEKMRGLGTDLRRVGGSDEVRAIGKLRFFRSGRVQLVMQEGGTLELESGIAPKASQQLVLMDGERKRCEEMQNTIADRLVAVPALGGL